MTDVWERRIRRAEELERLWPHSAEILRFFRGVTELQREVWKDVQGSTFHEYVHEGPQVQRVASHAERAASLIETGGPDGLRRSLGELRRRYQGGSGTDWERLLREYEGEAFRRDGDLPEFFLPKALMQPYMMTVALTVDTVAGASGETSAVCGNCGWPPAVGVLREDREAETLRRSLLCSLCSTEWDFPRVLCPACREERPEKLPRLTAQEIPWVRVEACDSCMKYLKAVDLSKEPGAEPVVDELASTPLDLLARERGYAKIAPNLAGI